MKRQDAEALLRHVDEVIDAIDACGRVVVGIADDAERKALTLALGTAAGEITTGVFMHVTKQYPDLDPYARRPR